MDSHTVLLREVNESDYPFILRINDENVEVLSPMEETKLKKFVEFAELFLVAEVNGNPAAFLIALREGVKDYKSENYLWFSEKYSKFLYIDRVVVDKPYRGMNIGKTLYQAVFAHAHETAVTAVTAEIDTIPYNEASLKFHEVMGFREVGSQFIRNGSIKVSLQKADAASDLPG